jgi:hypothetical protein
VTTAAHAQAPPAALATEQPVPTRGRIEAITAAYCRVLGVVGVTSRLTWRIERTDVEHTPAN